MTGGTLIAKEGNQVIVWKIRHDGYFVESFIEEELVKRSDILFSTIVPEFQKYFGPIPNPDDEISTKYVTGFHMTVPTHIGLAEVEEHVHDVMVGMDDGFGCTYSDYIAVVDFKNRQILVNGCDVPWSE